MKSKKSTGRMFRICVERLENRVMLHAGHGDANHQAFDAHPVNDWSTVFGLTDVPASVMQIAPSGTGFVDPHLVDDKGSLEPVDFDKILGIPKGSSGPEIERLPDFFPSITGGFSLDQTTQPGRTLVRFGTQVNNQGNGPAVLISGRPGIDPIPSGAPITSWLNADGSQNVIQAIYDYNGSSFSLLRYIQAGTFTYHSGHGHFHYDGYAYYKLRQNVAGQPGPYVTRNDGTGVIGEKVGFCLINIASSFTMENGQSSTTLVGYNRPGQPSTGCGLLQGIHVGRADIYSSSLEGQWLDVTGVPNGSYFLEMTLDGEDAVLETNENNNTKNFAFNLNANPGPGGINPDVFDANGQSNNSFDTAVDMGEMGTFAQTGLTIHWGQDFDYFRFVATSSGVSTVTANSSSGDINLFLYDANRNQIGSSSNSGSSESISYNFTAGQTYFVKADAYNSTTVSNYQIRWNLKPTTESLTAIGIATEAGRTGQFVISRNGPTTSPLTVHFTLTGTAVNGVDYQSVPLSVTLGDLLSEAVIDIVPIADNIPENAETVILTISSNNAYVVGASGSQLAIADHAGDFDLDGFVNSTDVDQLVSNLAIGPTNPSTFDLTNDNRVDQGDLTEWLRLAGARNLASGQSYLVGDANLDGSVDGQDFNIWNENKFTTVAAWSSADFNASGGVDGEDFNLWNANKFTSALRTGGPVAVLPSQELTSESKVMVSSVRAQRWKSIVDAAFGATSGEELWF
jgi:Lysyl oxidase/Bacterial pre-peptidase C-terminal domain